MFLQYIIRKQAVRRNACLIAMSAVSILYDTTTRASVSVKMKKRVIALRMSFIELRRNIVEVHLRLFFLSLFRIFVDGTHAVRACVCSRSISS